MLDTHDTIPKSPGLKSYAPVRRQKAESGLILMKRWVAGDREMLSKTVFFLLDLTEVYF